MVPPSASFDVALARFCSGIRKNSDGGAVRIHRNSCEFRYRDSKRATSKSASEESDVTCALAYSSGYYQTPTWCCPTKMGLPTRIVHVGRSKVAQVIAGTAHLSQEEHAIRKPTQSWRPKFRRCLQLLVPAYIAPCKSPRASAQSLTHFLERSLLDNWTTPLRAGPLTITACFARLRGNP